MKALHCTDLKPKSVAACRFDPQVILATVLCILLAAVTSYKTTKSKVKLPACILLMSMRPKRTNTTS